MFPWEYLWNEVFSGQCLKIKRPRGVLWWIFGGEEGVVYGATQIFLWKTYILIKLWHSLLFLLCLAWQLPVKSPTFHLSGILPGCRKKPCAFPPRFFKGCLPEFPQPWDFFGSRCCKEEGLACTGPYHPVVPLKLNHQLLGRGLSVSPAFIGVKNKLWSTLWTSLKSVFFDRIGHLAILFCWLPKVISCKKETTILPRMILKVFATNESKRTLLDLHLASLRVFVVQWSCLPLKLTATKAYPLWNFQWLEDEIHVPVGANKRPIFRGKNPVRFEGSVFNLAHPEKVSISFFLAFLDQKTRHPPRNPGCQC